MGGRGRWGYNHATTDFTVYLIVLRGAGSLLTVNGFVIHLVYDRTDQFPS